ncbi:DNA-binding protein WhiA [Thermovenabulum sp.]|uniref:DNA-binding protein WhiA n=1 Tax=Thermovenabulum sp. TaxID=3100335 RepID=UPI003C7C8803
MSFSSELKEEISKITDKDCCGLAELSALIKMSGGMSPRGDSIVITVHTENAAVARRFIQLMKKYETVEFEITVEKEKLRNKNLYLVKAFSREKKMEEFLSKIGIISVKNGKITLEEGIKFKIFKKRCCKKAYLRGAFLGGGSISDPKRAHHLEFITNNIKIAHDLSKLMEEFNISSKITRRKEKYVVYLKNGDNIKDLLGLMGANESLLKFENERVLKDMRNNVNRLVNCETANLNKTIDAAFNQMEFIIFLKEKGILPKLSPVLQEIAEMRLKFPELSLKELGQIMDPPLSKSGVSHRLKRLKQIAEKFKQFEGGNLNV